MSTALAKLGEAPQDVITAIQGVEKTSPETAEIIANYLDQVRSQNITVLGANEMLNLRDNGGEIRAFKRAIQLTANDGTLVQPVPGGPYVVSAQGYEKINEATGTIVMNADYVLVDGVQQQNPHVVRDKGNGRILAIYARAIAFRYSPLGIPQVSDRTTVFDVPAYRLIDLLAKAKKTPQAFKLLPAGMEPSEKGTWAKYAFDESTFLWVNTAHEEALQFFAQIINREKKAIDFAQTFAQRNASKHLHGIQKAPSANWNMPVITWRPMNEGPLRWDIARYNQTQKALTELADGKTHGEMPQIELEKGVDYLTDEEAGVIDAEAEPEDQEQSQPATSSSEREAPEDPVWPQLDAMKEAVPDIYEEAVQVAIKKKKATLPIVKKLHAMAVMTVANELTT